jgi:glutathione peroxidase
VHQLKQKFARALGTIFVLGLALSFYQWPAFAVEDACPALLDRKLPTLTDHSTSLCQYRGKVVLIVNTASQCGYTPQYDGLEKLYQRYQEKGLVVLGFPANDFGGQEPGNNEQIEQFCRLNYGVSFPMFAKSSVTGAQANSLYKELANKTGKPPRWNFYKYLVDRKGQVAAVFESAVEPEDRRVTGQIEKLLAAR